MEQFTYDMQKSFAEILLKEENQRVTKFSNNDIWIDGELVCEDGEIIK